VRVWIGAKKIQGVRTRSNKNVQDEWHTNPEEKEEQVPPTFKCCSEEYIVMIHLRSPFGSLTVARGYADSASPKKNEGATILGYSQAAEGVEGGNTMMVSH
jgi:hypothetical protein